jgi:hypothetical protein
MVSFYWNAAYHHYTNKAYYCSSSTDTNHAVLLAGWDDNFPSSNFNTPPAGDGAWLCKNSWDTTWSGGDGGYFWISYHDSNFGYPAAFHNAESLNNYDAIYAHDEFGWVFSWTYPWSANMFIATANHSINAVGILPTGSCNYTIKVYKGCSSTDPVSGTLSSTTTGSISMAGYYTIPLNTPVSVNNGQRFSVVVQYTSAPTYPTATEGYYSGYSSGCTSSTGESFYSNNGTSWTDFHSSYPSYSANPVIKAYAGVVPTQEDILGSWGSGVWYRSSGAGIWVNLTTPADPIAAGDLDGDGLADMLGVWTGSGVWVRYSSTGGWAKLSSPPLPVDITCGDVNGDGRDDLIGSWPSGTFYRNTLGGSWVYVTSTADVLASGDIDGDGIDDILGSWSTGLWVNYSSTGSWSRLDSHPPDDIACGDMNGDGRDDVLGTWSAYGTYFRDTLGGSWVYVSTPADHLASGDINGDGVDDLIGTWSPVSYQGLWVKYSMTTTWKKIVKNLPTDIDAGLYSGGAWDANAEGQMSIQLPMVGRAEGPGKIMMYEDIADKGPGGWNFVYQREANFEQNINEAEELKRVPGPGEPGFSYTQQKNLLPNEETVNTKKMK